MRDTNNRPKLNDSRAAQAVAAGWISPEGADHLRALVKQQRRLLVQYAEHQRLAPEEAAELRNLMETIRVRFPGMPAGTFTEALRSAVALVDDHGTFGRALAPLATTPRTMGR